MVINISMDTQSFVNKFDTMYPTGAWMINNSEFLLPEYCKHCSIYGYSFGDSLLEVDNKIFHLEKNQYFGLGVKNSAFVKASSKLFIVCRLGFITPNVLGWVEEKGRLTYIDGCSDTILVYPSRLGDPSLNLLYFPTGIDQSFHTHPSIRVGCVIDGFGISEMGDKNKEISSNLNYGDLFYLDQQQRHRFKTVESSMTVIAFHPDGDWGPTDHNHAMINRTYL